MPRVLRPRPVPTAVSVAAALGASSSATYLAVAGIFEGARSTPWLIVAIVVSAAISTVGAVRAAVLGFRRETLLDRQEAVREHLQNTLFSASQLTGVDVRRWNAVFMIVIGRGDRARLVAAVRAGFGPHENSNVRWTRGKGVVGEAWRTEQVVFDDISPVYAAHRDAGPEAWSRVPDAVRRGLTYRDWVVTRGKYGTIVAACTRDADDAVTGVVSLNVPHDAVVASHEQDLKDLVLTAAVHIGLIAR